MLGYLSADIICSEKRTVFRGRSLRKTVSFEEQIMSKDKYPSIFSQPNWGYCVYYPSVLKIGEYPRIFPSFSWGIFVYVTRLDQSRGSANIWCIIKTVIGRKKPEKFESVTSAIPVTWISFIFQTGILRTIFPVLRFWKIWLCYAMNQARREGECDGCVLTHPPPHKIQRSTFLLTNDSVGLSLALYWTFVTISTAQDHGLLQQIKPSRQREFSIFVLFK